jgi:hypothetical protein
VIRLRRRPVEPTAFVLWAACPVIVCRLCGSISALRGDVDNRYCARCHLFHEHVAQARAMHAAGASHECDEWRTARGRCAVCDRALEAPARGG